MSAFQAEDVCLLHTILSKTMDIEIKKIIEKISEGFVFGKTEIDEKALKFGGVRQYILNILKNSKFRIGSLTKELEDMIEQKVDLSLKKNLPITLVPAFGGFKNYQCLSFPNIDFAELMQLQFLLESVILISKIYKPGLMIEYTLDAHAMCVADNYKLEDVDVYVEGFREMLEKVQKVLPSNVVLKMTSFYDFYDLNEVKKVIEERLVEAMKSEKYRALIEERIVHAKNDFVFDGWENFTEKTSEEKQNLLEESVWKHRLWLNYDYEKRVDYIEGGERIPLGHRKFPGLLAIKSIIGSDIQFWVANGVFRHFKDTWKFELLTPNMAINNSVETVFLDMKFFDINTLNKIYLCREE